VVAIVKATHLVLCAVNFLRNTLNRSVAASLLLPDAYLSIRLYPVAYLACVGSTMWDSIPSQFSIYGIDDDFNLLEAEQKFRFRRLRM
jgi:hypothetical protein